MTCARLGIIPLLGVGALAASVFAAPPLPEGLDLRHVASIAVQSDGRTAAFDTAARQAVRHVCGRERWQGHDAMTVVLSWMFARRDWLEVPCIKVEHEPLKIALNLPVERRHFSLRELSMLEPLQRLIVAADEARHADRPLDALQRQADDVAGRMGALQHFLSGGGLALVPPAGDPNGAYVRLDEIKHRADAGALHAAWTQTGQAFVRGDAVAFDAASRQLGQLLRSAGGAAYPSPTHLAREIHYNRVHPFRWAWIASALAMVLGLAGMYLRRARWDALTVVATAVGCGFFLYGFVLRWLIAGRAPLSNMYESLVMFAGSIGLFALIFYFVFRQRVALTVAAALSAAGLILADVLPLDASIRTLPPVLRNTAWLTIHVLTIMLGYGAAALSMGVAHVQLGLHTLAPQRVAQAKEVLRLNYWIMLVAVIFLTAGIVFGAVWANASWGRYWGWDPKETWSLITLFGYLGVLHARFTGWLRDFGVAVASIVCFQLVLMTYYGVNYVLGTGLHSYGFGAGGLGWIAAYLGVECAVIFGAILRYRAVSARADSSARTMPRVPALAR